MANKTYTKEDLERVQNTFSGIINKYRIALADSIRRPLGVIPNSAKGLISDTDLQMAETRRQLFNKEEFVVADSKPKDSENPFPYGF